MARNFNGSSDQITFSMTSQIDGATYGGMFAVIKRADESGWHGFLTRKSSGGDDESYLDIAPSSHGTNNALWGNYASAASAGTIKVTNADGWVIVGVTKATGTAAIRFHKYVFSTNTWTHENGSSMGNAVGTTGGSVVIGNVSGDYFKGDIDVAAIFPTALSDGDVETLDNSLTAWDSLSPAGMWVLDQASTGTSVTDRTGNGANQSALSGTSVVAGSPLTSTGVAGIAASSLPTLTQSGAGTRTVPGFSGSGSATLPALTQAGAGAVTAPGFTGTAASALPGLTQAGAGTHAPPAFTGAAASTLGALTQSASGVVAAPAATGAAASALPALTQAASGTYLDEYFDTYSGDIGTTLPALTQAAEGTRTLPGVTGTASTSLPALEQAATGAALPPAFTGAAASVLAAVVQLAAGTTLPPAYAGTAASTLPGLTQAGTGAVDNPEGAAGSAASTLPALTQAGAGTYTPPTAGTATSTLPALTQAAAGTHTPPIYAAVIATILPALTQSARDAIRRDTTLTATGPRGRRWTPIGPRS